MVFFSLKHSMESLLRLCHFLVIIFFISLVAEKYFHMVLLFDTIHFIDNFGMHEVINHLRFDVT